MATHKHDRATFPCGPHRGYCGEAYCEPGEDVFHGEVIGTRDVIAFQGTTPKEIRDAFAASVDDYLAFCKSKGRDPEKPFSGSFLLRFVNTDLHKQASHMAASVGMSLNQFLNEAVSHMINSQVTAVQVKEFDCRNQKPKLAKPPEKKPAQKGRGKVKA